MIVEPDVVEADLAAGRLRCPSCEWPLARWGFARERHVRQRDGERSIRPRRARCEPCQTTHVLLPPDRRAAPAAASDGARLAAHVRPSRRADRRERQAVDARDRRPRPRRTAPGQVPARRCRRRARKRSAGLPATSGDVRLAVGAGRRAHRPAAWPPARTARLLNPPASSPCLWASGVPARGCRPPATEGRRNGHG